MGLLKSSTRRRLGGPTGLVPTSVRYDGVEHYMQSTSQGRCAYCNKNTTPKNVLNAWRDCTSIVLNCITQSNVMYIAKISADWFNDIIGLNTNENMPTSIFLTYLYIKEFIKFHILNVLSPLT